MNPHPSFPAAPRQPCRRRLLLASIVLALAVGSSHAAEPSHPFPTATYATLQASNAVENLQTGQVFADLPSAHYLAVSKDGAQLLVSSATQPEAWLLDARNGQRLATFNVGATPQGVAISPDGHLGLAVGAGDGTVSLIDLAKRQVLAKIDVGKNPHNALFTADGKLAYVTLQGEGKVAVIDVHARAVTGTFPVPGLDHPHNLAFSANGKTLWIRGFVGKVAAVDLASRKVLAVIPVGLGHAGIDVVPGSSLVVTGAVADHVVDVIDPKTYQVIRRIDVGQGPHGVRVSRDGRWIYAGVTATDRIAVIDARTLQVVAQVPTRGKLPFWLTVTGRP